MVRASRRATVETSARGPDLDPVPGGTAETLVRPGTDRSIGLKADAREGGGG